MTIQMEVAWAFGEITDVKGSADRPLPSDAWQVPNVVELDGDRLVWIFDLSADMKQATRVLRAAVRRPGPGMLDGFVRLADAPPTAIRDYARRWGMLHICEHGLPRSHNPPSLPLGSAAWRGHPDEGCQPMRCTDDGTYDEYWHWEPLSRWRWHAAQARAILNMIVAIRAGEAGKPEDVWAAHASYARLRWKPATAAATKLVVAACIDELLALGRVRPTIQWLDGDAGLMLLGDGGLFQALSVQLMMHAGRTDGLAMCSACGIAYTPTRRPRAGERRYCHDCRSRGAPERDAASAYRERHRQGGSA